MGHEPCMLPFFCYGVVLIYVVNLLPLVNKQGELYNSPELGVRRLLYSWFRIRIPMYCNPSVLKCTRLALNVAFLGPIHNLDVYLTSDHPLPTPPSHLPMIFSQSCSQAWLLAAWAWFSHDTCILPSTILAMSSLSTGSMGRLLYIPSTK